LNDISGSRAEARYAETIVQPEPNETKMGYRKASNLSCYEVFNAGFFPMSKADLTAAPGACMCACDQADGKSNAAQRKKDKLKGP
jgi:hypothetical protein